MVVVIARPSDPVAGHLLERFDAGRAVLVEPRDLSRLGWLHDPLAPSLDMMVTREGPIPLRHVSAVLVRLGSITEHDLSHIAATDRSYVAAECTAFLLSLLSSSECPVVNRPTPRCLAGPVMSAEEWAWVAFEAGLPVAPLNRTVSLHSDREPTSSGSRQEQGSVRYLVIDGYVSPSDGRTEAHLAVRLAALVNARLLEVRFSPNHAFPLFATPLPRHLGEEPLDAIANLLRGGLRQ